jgi:hypothetical protein
VKAQYLKSYCGGQQAPCAITQIPAERRNYELRHTALCSTAFYVFYVGHPHIHNDLEHAAELSSNLTWHHDLGIPRYLFSGSFPGMRINFLYESWFTSHFGRVFKIPTLGISLVVVRLTIRPVLNGYVVTSTCFILQVEWINLRCQQESYYFWLLLQSTSSSLLDDRPSLDVWTPANAAKSTAVSWVRILASLVPISIRRPQKAISGLNPSTYPSNYFDFPSSVIPYIPP